ncbi:MAG: GNAT family N-acetyltransferase [Clostridiales bacterium]|jgi:release factor glutamine methyltransferase|nr:GNAT family N-acetyltransferase [Clostridiales bacterium]
MEYIIKNIMNEYELDNALEFEKGFFTHYDCNSEYTREKWLVRMQKHAGLMLYAELNGAVIGIVFGRVEDNGFMTVGPVATGLRYRGKGIAQKLMAELEKRAVEKGITGITLGAAEAAEGFYVRLGYTGSLLVQSEKHSIDELLAYSGKYPVKYTNIYDGTINQVCFELDEPDRELQRAYEKELGDCWTQMVFMKKLLPEIINIPEYGDVCILNEYVDSVKTAKGYVICRSDMQPSVVMNLLKEDNLIIMTGGYLRSSYILHYVHHYENTLSGDLGAENKRVRVSRLCFAACKNSLADVNGFPAGVDFKQWLGENTSGKIYLLPLRRMERIMTDIRRSEEGIAFDFLKSKIFIKPFVYVPSDTSIPKMFLKYVSVFKDKSVADMGTGTGLLALFAAQSGAASVTAVDINPAAAACAYYNVVKSCYTGIVSVVESNLFEEVNGKFDVIIFNAPWVQGKPKNMYELAIYDNNFTILKRFISTAGDYLNQDGIILLQISDISQQTDGSLDILYGQLEHNGFTISVISYIKRKNRMFGKTEKVYLFEVKRVKK